MTSKLQQWQDLMSKPPAPQPQQAVPQQPQPMSSDFSNAFANMVQRPAPQMPAPRAAPQGPLSQGDVYRQLRADNPFTGMPAPAPVNPFSFRRTPTSGVLTPEPTNAMAPQPAPQPAISSPGFPPRYGTPSNWSRPPVSQMMQGYNQAITGANYQPQPAPQGNMFRGGGGGTGDSTNAVLGGR